MTDIQTTYTYKVYSGSTYLGLLDHVTSLPDYPQDINTMGSQITIQLADSFDKVDAETVVVNLVDEAGNRIVDEVGNHIIVSRSYQFNGIPINLGNRVVVTEYSKYNPNGKTYFDGFIFDWQGDYKANSIQLTVISHGVRADNFIVDPDQDIAITQSTYNSSYFLASGSPKDPGQVAGQTFSPNVNFDLATIGVYMSTTSATAVTSATLYLYQGSPATGLGSLLAVVENNTMTNTTPDIISFTLASPITLTAGQTYFFWQANSGADTSFYGEPIVAYQNSSLYANGQMFTSPTGANGTWTGQTADIAFVISSSSGSVSATFSSVETSTIVRTALNIFNNKGGIVTYSDASIDDTGISVSYTFLLATVYETIKKGYELAASSWYYYADVATNLLHMHDSAQVADHTFILGRHLDNIQPGSTLSTVKNYIALSGGNDGSGSNLFRVTTDNPSIVQYGQWLDRVSDNRITSTETADIYSLARLGKFAVPPFNVPITIPASKYDTSSITLGQMVAFGGFNNFIDSLLLQIVWFYRHRDSIELKLGIPAVRTGRLIDDLQRRMIQQETENNPTTTS